MSCALLLGAPTDTLHPGDPLPVLSNDTVAGKPLQLPSAAAGQISVIIFSFSKTAGNDARLWNSRLAKDFETLPRFVVIMLEAAPRLMRGIIVSGIKSGMPPAERARTVIMLKEEALWKKRLAVSDENRSYVIALDRDSRIRWINSGPFAEPAYAALKESLSR